MVRLQFVRGADSVHLVREDEVALLVEATKQLHHTPGVNPANMLKASKVWRITSAAPHYRKPYWWSTPGLGEKPDVRGARIIQEGPWEVLFEDYSLVADRDGN